MQITYFAVRGIRVNPFSCVIQHFQCSAMSAIMPSPIRKSEGQTVQHACISAKPDFVMIQMLFVLSTKDFQRQNRATICQEIGQQYYDGWCRRLGSIANIGPTFIQKPFRRTTWDSVLSIHYTINMHTLHGDTFHMHTCTLHMHIIHQTTE